MNTLIKSSAVLTTLAIVASVASASEPTQAFKNPNAIPTFGANNYVVTYDTTDPTVAVDFGTADQPGSVNLWNVGDGWTTKQQYQQIWANRVVATPSIINPDASGGFVTDGSATLTDPKLTVRAPGFATSTGDGRFYSFGGDYGAHLNVSNYGGATNSISGRGTLVVLQTAASSNPGFYPVATVGKITGLETINAGQLTVTKQDGSAIDGGVEVLGFDTTYVESVTTGFGASAYQQLLWTLWLPEYTGDFKIDFDLPVHTNFYAARVDTSIGSLGTAGVLSSFAAVPEPTSLAVIGLGAAGLLRRRSRKA